MAILLARPPFCAHRGRVATLKSARRRKRAKLSLRTPVGSRFQVLESGRRHERGELVDELLRREDDARRAVAPTVLQTVENTAVFEP
jgi:hypothetical protein